MEQAMSAFETYPKLMMLHMASNYTTYGFEKIRMETEEDKVKFRQRLTSSLTMRCFMVASYHSAASAIDVNFLTMVEGEASADLTVGDYFEEGGSANLAVERRGLKLECNDISAC
jgi:hypothetical protein